MMKQLETIMTQEQKTLQKAIDIIEHKKFFGFTKSEKDTLDFAAERLKKFLPKPVAKEGGNVFCPCCSAILPFKEGDAFLNLYCVECGQNIYNREEK